MFVFYLTDFLKPVFYLRFPIPACDGGKEKLNRIGEQVLETTPQASRLKTLSPFYRR